MISPSTQTHVQQKLSNSLVLGMFLVALLAAQQSPNISQVPCWFGLDDLGKVLHGLFLASGCFWYVGLVANIIYSIYIYIYIYPLQNWQEKNAGVIWAKAQNLFFWGVGPMWGVHREIGEGFQNLGWVPCQRSLFEADLRLLTSKWFEVTPNLNSGVSSESPLWKINLMFIIAISRQSGLWKYCKQHRYLWLVGSSWYIRVKALELY